jgi:hypothetical protein
MSLEAENVHIGVSHIRHRFPVTFLRPCRFIYCDCLFFFFYKMKTIPFNTSHQFIFLCKEERAKILPFVAFFNRHLKESFF